MERKRKHDSMEEVLEKAAALKKAKKAEKKKRQKLKNGKVVLSDEDYAAARAIQGESAKVVRRERYLAAKSFKVPDDVSLRQIQNRDPTLWSEIHHGEKLSPTQQDEEYRARACWLNQFDPKRTFDTHHKQARMLYATLKVAARRAQQNGEKLTELEYYFMNAVTERRREDRGDDVAFDWRNWFIEEWLTSDIDVYIFTPSDLKIFKSMKRRFGNALPGVEEFERTGFLEHVSLSANDTPAFAAKNPLPQREVNKETTKGLHFTMGKKEVRLNPLSAPITAPEITRTHHKTGFLASLSAARAPVSNIDSDDDDQEEEEEAVGDRIPANEYNSTVRRTWGQLKKDVASDDLEMTELMEEFKKVLNEIEDEDKEIEKGRTAKEANDFKAQDDGAEMQEQEIPMTAMLAIRERK